MPTSKSPSARLMTGPLTGLRTGSGARTATATVSGEGEDLRIPRHVAIIMDGNGRWAKQRHLPPLAGHRAGTQNIRKVIQSFSDFGVQYLTLYAFSTENWSRPKDEVNGLFGILRDVIERVRRTEDAMHPAANFRQQRDEDVVEVLRGSGRSQQQAHR